MASHYSPTKHLCVITCDCSKNPVGNLASKPLKSTDIELFCIVDYRLMDVDEAPFILEMHNI